MASLNKKDDFTIMPVSDRGQSLRNRIPANKRYRNDIFMDVVFATETDTTKPCAVCHNKRPDFAIVEMDPYCSTKCCRKDHNLVDSSAASMFNTFITNPGAGSRTGNNAPPDEMETVAA